MGGFCAEREVRVLLCSLTALAAVGNATALEQCVSVRITNCYARSVSIAYGPVTLCAESRVTPDERHRYLETVFDYAPDSLSEIGPQSSDNDDDPLGEPDKQNGAVGSSLRSLDGERERVQHSVKMHALEGGVYEIVSTVYADESRKKVCGRATARVIVR